MLVRQAFENVCQMLDDGRTMFTAATGYLLDNEILDVNLSEMDEEINEREHVLRRLVLGHLNVDPDRELVFCLKMLSIVQEAERIGDIAKSLAKVGRLAQRPRMDDQVAALRVLRDRILLMFDEVNQGLIENDQVAARSLMKAHEGVKQEVTRYLEEVATGDGLTANQAVVYALAARLISRTSSHLANIASTVVSPFDRIRSAPTWNNDDAG